MRTWPYDPYRHFTKQLYDTNFKRYDKSRIPTFRNFYRHASRNKHHYKFIALSITLALLAALSLYLATT